MAFDFKKEFKEFYTPGKIIFSNCSQCKCKRLYKRTIRCIPIR